MLFRIQTVWLLLAAISLGLMFVLSIYTLPNGQSIDILNHYLNTILVAVNIGILLFSIFKYKQLKSQMYFGLLSILLSVVTLALIFLDIQSKNSTPELSQMSTTPAIGGSYSFGAFLPVASIILVFLALNGIRKDRKTIKDAYQRLR